MTTNPFKAIGFAMAVAGKEKSFRANPVLGSPRLNKMGLHRSRVTIAAKLSDLRRKGMARGLSREDRENFDENGYFLKTDYLSPEDFAALKADVFEQAIAAREMRQGQTVTRMASLSALPGTLGRSIAARRDLNAMLNYASGRRGAPVIGLQTVIADQKNKRADPQTQMHADTFHPTAKMWLFLTDVGEEDGPFVFVPGSHKLTPERLNWEYEQSLTAQSDERLHHALGSFRITPDMLPSLGYGSPRRMAVKANTLIVADTFGFHHRASSDKPTTRVELYGYLRRNPFIPWNGLDLSGLPGVRGRQLDWFFRYLSMREKHLSKTGIWKDVGKVQMQAKARI